MQWKIFMKHFQTNVSCRPEMNGHQKFIKNNENINDSAICTPCTSSFINTRIAQKIPDVKAAPY